MFSSTNKLATGSTRLVSIINLCYSLTALVIVFTVHQISTVGPSRLLQDEFIAIGYAVASVLVIGSILGCIGTAYPLTFAGRLLVITLGICLTLECAALIAVFAVDWWLVSVRLCETIFKIPETYPPAPSVSACSTYFIIAFNTVVCANLIVLVSCVIDVIVTVKRIFVAKRLQEQDQDLTKCVFCVCVAASDSHMPYTAQPNAVP